MTIQLIHGDCLDVDWPQVDAIITDLPYGVTACKWDSIIPFEPMWAKIKSSLKTRGAFVTTASQPFTSALVMSNPKWFKYEWIWDKVNKTTNFVNAKYRPLCRHENILVFADGKTNFNPIMTEGKAYKKTGSFNAKIYNNMPNHDKVGKVYTERNPQTIIAIKGDDKKSGFYHPTQKPVALYEYLIKTYTNEGDTVLDFCAGSGTSLQGCINTGRNGIGIEKDEKYYNIAKERLGL